jgi:hypothetical protein
VQSHREERANSSQMLGYLDVGILRSLPSRLSALAAARFRHAPARSPCELPHHSDPARPRQSGDHGALSACSGRSDQRQPAGFARPTLIRSNGEYTISKNLRWLAIVTRRVVSSTGLLLGLGQGLVAFRRGQGGGAPRNGLRAPRPCHAPFSSASVNNGIGIAGSY